MGGAHPTWLASRAGIGVAVGRAYAQKTFDRHRSMGVSPMFLFLECEDMGETPMLRSVLTVLAHSPTDRETVGLIGGTGAEDGVG